MDLMEYKAKELFDKYEIFTQTGVVVNNVDDVKSRVDGMTFPVVIKAQVQTGGRGKAGGVRFAENAARAEEVAKSILGMDIKGHIVKEVLIVEKAEIVREFYLCIMLDRLAKSPVIIFSPMGGVDIEETAKSNPDKVIKIEIDLMIGIRDYTVRYLINRSGLNKDLYEQLSQPLYELLRKLYKMFIENDCLLVEINPLVVSPEGKLIALDGKVSVDDNALYRQPDMLEFRDSLNEDELVVQARNFGFLYVPCEPDGNIAVMSNGSGMVMSCMDLISAQGMKVGAAFDLGGGATSDRIAEAVKIVLLNKKIDTLFISIFGGITRCDEVAGGLKLAMESRTDDRMVVIRIDGTNKEEGLKILKSIKGSIIPVDSIREGVTGLAARRCVIYEHIDR